MVAKEHVQITHEKPILKTANFSFETMKARRE